jgi:hypothetical protein
VREVINFLFTNSAKLPHNRNAVSRSLSLSSKVFETHIILRRKLKLRENETWTSARWLWPQIIVVLGRGLKTLDADVPSSLVINFTTNFHNFGSPFPACGKKRDTQKKKK